MKSVILAGGSGSRLFPLTRGVNKHLLPIFDKPLIFYPLATAMLAGARDVTIVVRPADLQAFQGVLGDGSTFGIEIEYVIQNEPRGIADALIRSEGRLQGQELLLILGDNIFHGPLLGESLRGRVSSTHATIFSYEVSDPKDYACIEVDTLGRPVTLVEKPETPRSNLAVPGIYFLPPDSFDIARSLKPSSRGELEITDLNNVFLAQDRLHVVPLPRGTAWMDTGTPEALNEASNYVRLLQQRQGLPIACPEEIALRSGWIDEADLDARIAEHPNTSYSMMLSSVVARRTPRS
jgi:glucose-1-phosphate thymidylyltransferase